ncbi:hypothetical protein R3P38DRAFT_2784753 [Favolaschia claudopus]|uniref:Uncharacterized protein n=1 Tax=Favolaschia claudopus TaxID=2862362 RepID=A0AAW0AWQ4_9AGAR
MHSAIFVTAKFKCLLQRLLERRRRLICIRCARLLAGAKRRLILYNQEDEEIFGEFLQVEQREFPLKSEIIGPMIGLGGHTNPSKSMLGRENATNQSHRLQWHASNVHNVFELTDYLINFLTNIDPPSPQYAENPNLMTFCERLFGQAVTEATRARLRGEAMGVLRNVSLRFPMRGLLLDLYNFLNPDQILMINPQYSLPAVSAVTSHGPNSPAAQPDLTIITGSSGFILDSGYRGQIRKGGNTHRISNARVAVVAFGKPQEDGSEDKYATNRINFGCQWAPDNSPSRKITRMANPLYQ